MKNKVFILFLSFTLILSSIFMVYAEPGKGKGQEKGDKSNTIYKSISLEIKKEYNKNKAQIEAQKDEAEALKNDLEAKYEAAVATGNTELAATLSEQLQSVREQFNDSKMQLKNLIQERKQIIKENYTEEELEAIETAKEHIRTSNPHAAILDVDSIISNSADFKFDTPPVIKAGRTIIPVRAITKGFGAELDWDSETREVTITKGDITIVLTIDSNTALVNGTEVSLDSKAEIMNNRTYVPLRFILETFGLKVNWDDDTDTIEIEEPDDEDLDEVRTGSAIVI